MDDYVVTVYEEGTSYPPEMKRMGSWKITAASRGDARAGILKLYVSQNPEADPAKIQAAAAII